MIQIRPPRIVLTALLIGLWLSASTAAFGQSKTAAKETPPAPKYNVGDVAPDFTLKDQNGKEVSLHDFRGKKSVALAFFVFAFSGG
jgi:cytochrome oxidase Cu insertion factor (SCO1/SenC/PrrC family)